jgi:Glyoxalase-like domain
VRLELDHIVIAASNLEAGVSFAERALGVSMPAGGAHALMGTHNHLLRLSDSLFLEVIAPDPAAEVPRRPRWFALDDPRVRTELAASPRLVTWVVATHGIAAALRVLPLDVGPAVKVTRGDLEWRISIPADGSMPFNGAFPALIQWQAGRHPASRMPDLGCSLVQLEIAHPDGELIAGTLKPYFSDPRVRFSVAPAMSMRVTIKTPKGERQLS